MRFSNARDSRILKLLAMGVAVSFVVAWVFAVVSLPNTAGQPYEGLNPETEWNRHAAQDWDKPTLSSVERWRALGSDEIVVRPAAFAAMAGGYLETNTLFATDSGLPFRCLYHAHVTKLGESGQPTIWRCGFVVGGVRMPYGIHWFRLSVNSMFYAALSWLLFAGAVKLRSVIRMKPRPQPVWFKPF